MKESPENEIKLSKKTSNTFTGLLTIEPPSKDTYLMIKLIGLTGGCYKKTSPDV